MLRILTSTFKMNENKLRNIIGRIGANVISKGIVSILLMIFLGTSMSSVFAAECSSNEIDAIGINENGESFFRDEDHSESDLEDENSYSEDNSSDDTNSEIEFIKRIRKPEFKNWCKQNIKLIKKRNMNRNQAYHHFKYGINKDIEEKKAQKKDYYIKNITKIKKQKKNYYIGNITKIKKQQKNYYITHITEIKKQQKDYYITNKDVIRKRQKNYWDANKEKINARRREITQKRKAEANLAK